MKKEKTMSGIEKMCRLTYHLDQVLKYYKTYSYGILGIPEIQEALTRLDELLEHSEDWKREVKEAETWNFMNRNGNVALGCAARCVVESCGYCEGCRAEAIEYEGLTSVGWIRK